MQAFKESSVDVLVSREALTTIDHGINGTTLKKIADEMGRAEMIFVLGSYIADSMTFFNVQSGLTDEQAIQTAGILFSEFNHLTIEDLQVCFKEAKAQAEDYDRIYGRIDGAVIMSWVRTYFDRKLDRMEAVYAIQRGKYMEETNEAALGVFEAIGDKIAGVINRERPGIEKPPAMTMESHLSKVRQQLPEFSPGQLISLRKGFSNQNLFGAYDEILKDIDEELKNR